MTGPERLADWLAAGPRGVASVVGINGAQGSGKSTLAASLQDLLQERHGLSTAILSIDDLYLGRAAREQLAREIHPLLRTRGVPGTHDVELGLELLAQLGRQGTVRLPRFIKARDDRAPEAQWRPVEAPVDLVLFEGWCVGTPPQPEAALQHPVNTLERDEDADGVWRRYVNTQLATRYAPLFARLERLVFLKAPDFDSIFRWRLEQEGKNAAAGGGQTMDPLQLRRFIQHYERLTRHALEVLPGRADAVIELGRDHEWRRLELR